MYFNELFKQIPAEEIYANINIFTLAVQDSYIITVGSNNNFNSMTGSGGGFGMLFRKPTAWCLLRRDRYTLELIQKECAYTLSYFTDEYIDQLILLGSKSGRDSGKMKEANLTSIQTPNGNISFKEAKLIIECKLTQITMPGLDDFFSHEAKEYINEAYKQESDYRKYVFGEITKVWKKK